MHRPSRGQSKGRRRDGGRDRGGGETDAVCASFLAFAAKQTQIKTFDVNLLAMAKTTDYPQSSGGGGEGAGMGVPGRGA